MSDLPETLGVLSISSRDDDDPFSKLPTLVLETITNYLDAATWMAIRQVSLVWQPYCPRVLLLDDSEESNAIYENLAFHHEIFQISEIRLDKLHGGPLRATCGGVYPLLREIVVRADTKFLYLEFIDLTGQWASLNLVTILFCEKTVADLPYLRRAALRLTLARYPYECRSSVMAPPSLKSLRLHFGWLPDDLGNDSMNPLAQLLANITHLAWISPPYTEARRNARWAFRITRLFTSPMKNLIHLETNEDFATELTDELLYIMPRLQLVTQHNGGSTFNYRLPAEYQQVKGKITLHRALIDSMFQVIKNDLFENRAAPSSIPLAHVNVDNWAQWEKFASSPDFTTVKTFMLRGHTIPGKKLDYILDNHLFIILRKCRCLRDLILPKRMLIAWSKGVPKGVSTAAGSLEFEFPSVRSIQFISTHCMTKLGTSHISPMLQCNPFPLSLLRRFPNITTLTIGPIIDNDRFSGFPDLELALPLLRKLVLFVACRQQRGDPQLILGIREWLPLCRQLEILVLFTDSVDLGNDCEDSRFLASLANNSSLKYVCIMTEAHSVYGSYCPLNDDLLLVTRQWRNRDWRILMFVERIWSGDNFRVTMCTPSQDFDEAQITENTYAEPNDLFRAYPELYTVFWQELCSEINFDL